MGTDKNVEHGCKSFADIWHTLNHSKTRDQRLLEIET